MKLKAPRGIIVGVLLAIAVWMPIIAVGVICLYGTGCKIPAIEIPDMPDTIPLPLPTTTTTTIPPSALPSNISWKGASYSRAALDPRVALRSANLDRHKIYYDMTLPASWPKQVVNGVNCQAIACFGYEENGKIVLGKYDWIRTGGQSVKETVNILDGYNGLRLPVQGTRCYSLLVSVDGKFRSELVEMTWR